MARQETFTLGLDFGTESGRALLVRVADGAEIADAVYPYPHGVMDRHLPDDPAPLPPDWALQDPDDYLGVLRHAVPAVFTESDVAPEQVVGIGIDFTSCTVLPTLRDGTPLCELPEFRREPHAWVKLWKHHAAQAQADRINEVARTRGESWLARYGGKYSSEWFFSKALEILEEAPEVYHRAERLIEAADWLVWQLTGEETRNVCTAGYKALYQDGTFPSRAFFAAVHPDLADVVDEKMSRTLLPLGAKAGSLSQKAAEWTGLKAGTPVAIANVDAHVTLPATGATDAGTLVMILGTSTCDVLVGETVENVEGMCGVVKGGIVPGRYGYEAGQSGVGDIFAWFVECCVPPDYHRQAEIRGQDLHAYLSDLAAKQQPGEHGLLALDWLSGNRSVLVDSGLTGLMLGLTLGTRAEDMYRALLEATAFGARVILEAFEASGVPVKRIIAAGGLPGKNPLLMQIYADVLGREIEIIKSEQGAALGSAIHAAVAAGCYETIHDAAKRMGGVKAKRYKPDRESVRAYQELYRDYRYLYDLFGRAQADEPGGLMKRLKARQRRARAARVAR